MIQPLETPPIVVFIKRVVQSFDLVLQLKNIWRMLHGLTKEMSC